MAGPIGPTTGRLALFYAVFALGFGNHLSMVLAAAGLYSFSPDASPSRRSRSAAAPDADHGRRDRRARGASIRMESSEGCGQSSSRRRRSAEALAKFWFDVTKADWRETLVMTVSETGTAVSPCHVLVRSAAAVRRARRRARRDRLLLRAVALAEARGFPPAVLCGQPERSRGRTTSATPISFFCRRTTSSRCVPVRALRPSARSPRACRVGRSRAAASAIAAALSRVARLRHVAGGGSELGSASRASCWTNSRSDHAQRRVWRGHELASAKRVRVLHARAQAGSPMVLHGRARMAAGKPIATRGSTLLSLATLRSAVA